MGDDIRLTAVQVTALSNDGALVARLADGKPDAAAAGGAPALTWQASAPVRMPGAIESIWQLLVDIGIVGLPVSVIGNLIASWIWTAAHDNPPSRNRQQSGQILLLLEAGERNAEVSFELGSPELTQKAMAQTIAAALEHVRRD
jgi:hypothetical protein